MRFRRRAGSQVANRLIVPGIGRLELSLRGDLGVRRCRRLRGNKKQSWSRVMSSLRVSYDQQLPCISLRYAFTFHRTVRGEIVSESLLGII